MTTYVLVLCRANRCRSPFAAEMLRRLLDGADVKVESAGLLPGGYAMPRTGQKVGRKLGMDFADHRSREFDPSDAVRADVILTMARDQARDVIAEADSLWPRVFTVVQFARWLDEHPYSGDAPLGEWIASTAHDRARSDLIGADHEDEIRDPVGRPATAWRAMVAELTPSLETIARGIRSTPQRPASKGVQHGGELSP